MRLRPGLRLFALLLMSGLMAGPGSLFAEETGWQGNDKSQLRLIAAPAEWQGKRQIFAGIEIRLAKDWKTYWRTPGDTGIPPYFDWSGSENLEKAEVFYPAPVRFKDPGGSSIGYKSSVTLPVVLVPKDPQKPVKLKLNANYAICYDLCVPVEAKQVLEVTKDASARNAPLIEMALTEVPKRVEGQVEDFGVEQVAYRAEGAAGALDFHLKLPADVSGLDLFIEGPDGLYVPTPVQLGERAAKGQATFRVDLNAADDAGVIKKARLLCTITTKRRAVVQPCPLKSQ